MNTAVSPTRSKSCSDTMKLAERNRLSPFAASTASVIVMSVPPMQYPITLTVLLPVISRATSLASSGPRSM